MLKFKFSGNFVEAWINDCQYYTTDKNGDGLFLIDLFRNSWKQLVGTCDFTVRNCKTDNGKKAKMRAWIKSYERAE